MSRTKELFLRVLSTIIFVPLFVYGLFFEHTFIIPILLTIAGLWALYEFYGLMGKTGYQPYCTLGYVFYVFLLVYSIYPVYFTFSLPLLLWLVLLGGFVTYLLSSYGSTPSFFANSGITILGLLYIGWPFSLLLNLRQGVWYIIWLIAVTWFCDIGAYLIGSAIGKHKLCPTISPGKTVEGLIGGILASLLAAVVTRYILLSHQIHFKFSFSTNLWLALAITTIGVLGDLAESVLKRQAGVKDSGNTFTGHGGMLDIVDSLLFTVPAFYYAMQILL
jgi:phosphatidate cytidylyltransferase